MADSTTQRNLTRLLFDHCGLGNGIGLVGGGFLLLPHTVTSRLTLILGLLCGLGLEHLLLRKHHCTALGRGQFTHTGDTLLYSHRLLSGHFHLFVHSGHRFHRHSPFQGRFSVST